MPDYTLTDVMIGLHKHDFINILTDEEWTFLTGLILYANERGFKNPIDLAVKQATHAGGGNSRQSVNRRRNSLAKIKVGGKPILKVTSGVPGQNIVATYEIDYNLICSYNGVWHDENEDASQKYNGKRTVGGRKADGGRDDPKIRSEEVREENNYDLPSPPETEEDERHDIICDAFKKAIGGDPNAITLVSNEHQLEAFNEILEHKDEYILEVINTAALKGKLHQDNALGYVRTGLRNGWYGTKDGGNSGSIASIREREEAKHLAKWREELADYSSREGDWSTYVDRLTEAIAKAGG